MKPAVVVLDMLKDFFQKDPLKKLKQPLSKNINQLVSSVRDKNIPVFWIRQAFKPDLSDAFLIMKKRKHKQTIEGTEGSEIIDELDVQEQDIILTKKRFSAFFKTDFNKILRKKGVDTLIICGINTHACTRMTAIDAYQHDFEVILAKDCLGSWDQDHHEITLKYLEKSTGMQILDNKEIAKII